MFKIASKMHIAPEMDIPSNDAFLRETLDIKNYPPIYPKI
jgi:hypothetical protein